MSTDPEQGDPTKMEKNVNKIIYEFIFYSLDLVAGWGPVMLKYSTELEFIRENQLHLSDNRSYWIGGTTYNEEREQMRFYNYMPNSGGRINLKDPLFIDLYCFECIFEEL